MNSTNRILNRAVLLIGGVLFAALGLVALLRAWRPATVEPVLAGIERSVEDALEAHSVTVLGSDIPVVLLAASAAALILAVALIIFVFARGRGGVPEVTRIRADDGRTDVDRNVVDAVLSGALTARPDVLSARTGVFRVEGVRTVRLAVTVRQGASLGDVLAAAEQAIRDWDSLLGGETPILIHLTDRGWLGRYRSATRVR
ncbi:hypothetical protein ACNPNP_15035 [Microbacterium sp. AGC85]